MKKINIILVLLIISSIFMGAWGMNSDLPYSRAAVEIAIMGMSVKLGTGDLNPHIFYYPHLFLYILFFFFGIFFIIGRISGVFSSVGDFQDLYFLDPSVFYIIARCVTLFFMSGSILLVYLIAKRLFNKKVALISAAFMTFNITNVQLSHFALPDIPVLFFSLLAFFAIVKIIDGASWKMYLLCGFLIGLASATKYQALFLVFSLLTAHILSCGRKTLKHIFALNKIPLSGVGGFAGFFLGSPYCLLDFGNFMSYFTRTAACVSSSVYGFACYRSDTVLPLYIVKDLLPFAMGWALAILCIISIVYAVKKHTKGDIVLLVTIALFLGYVTVAGWTYLKPRHIIHLFPLFFILSARFLYDISRAIFNPPSPVIFDDKASARFSLQKMRSMGMSQWSSKKKSVARTAFLGIVCFLVLIPSFREIYFYEKGILKTPIYVEAKNWIEAHIPAGSSIAMHDGIPLEPGRDSINRKLKDVLDKKAGEGTKLKTMLTNRHLFLKTYDIYELPYPWRRDYDESDFDFEAQVKNGVTYFVFTEELSHYMKEPEIYKTQLKYYDSVKNNSVLIKRFDAEYLRSELGVTGSPYILIYELRKE